MLRLCSQEPQAPASAPIPKEPAATSILASAVLKTRNQRAWHAGDAPKYGPTPGAAAFWKPVIAEVNARLQKRGLGGVARLGMVLDVEQDMRPAVELFKGVWPEGKWMYAAHQGGGEPGDYTMSVLGNFSKYRSKFWGAADLPFILIKCFRTDPVISLRVTGERGSLFWAPEVAMGGGYRGLGFVGADFWNLTAEERGEPPQKGPAPLENQFGHFNMKWIATAAFLAPGPDGPVSTARFEILREGVQACEARTVIERALGDEATRQRLGASLVARCREVINKRGGALGRVRAGGWSAADAWRRFANSGWEDLNGRLFDCAGDVTRALGGKQE